jgi:Fe-S cluster assembly iron-binding protein IscA
MALDESKDSDEVIEGEGFSVVVDKSLLEEMGGIKVDYRNSVFGAGFTIVPMGEFSGGCAC